MTVPPSLLVAAMDGTTQPPLFSPSGCYCQALRTGQVGHTLVPLPRLSDPASRRSVSVIEVGSRGDEGNGSATIGGQRTIEASPRHMPGGRRSR
jgi:hypothetical protein